MHAKRPLRFSEGGLAVLALGISLTIIALLSPASAPTFVLWLIGLGLLSFWAGREFATPKKKED